MPRGRRLREDEWDRMGISRLSIEWGVALTAKGGFEGKSIKVIDATELDRLVL